METTSRRRQGVRADFTMSDASPAQATGPAAARRAEAAERVIVVVIGAATTRVAPAGRAAGVAGVAEGAVALLARVDRHRQHLCGNQPVS